VLKADEGDKAMQTPSTSICSAARAAVALIPGLLRCLPAQGFRMADSSEELLDLFEERYGVHAEFTIRKAGDGPRYSDPSSRVCH
jgi:hypothetical protein